MLLFISNVATSFARALAPKLRACTLLLGLLGLIPSAPAMADGGPRVVQINFRMKVSVAEYERFLAPWVEQIASTKGLRWTIWLLNAKDREAGGIYLFDDEAAATAFLGGAFVEGLIKEAPVAKLSVKMFETMPDFSKLTRAPVN